MKTLQLLVLALTLFVQLRADQLITKNGTVFRGNVTSINDTEVTMALAEGGSLALPRSAIKSVMVESVSSESPKAAPKKVSAIQSGQHLPTMREIVDSIKTFEWGADVRQIPATIIDNGVLRFVPYCSYRVGAKYEVNIYGDPDAPIAMEIGYYDPAPNSWSEKGHCLSLILANLPGLVT